MELAVPVLPLYLRKMGAWGHGSYENDSALDWFGELQDAGPGLVEDALSVVADADDATYLEVDESSAALAAAELVAAAAGKGDDRLNEDVLRWLSAKREAVRTVDLSLARRAVDRVLRSSELLELWNENGGDTEWHAAVRELLRRLSPAANLRG
jgi:hypothetical protein